MSAEPNLKVVGAGFGRTGTLSLKLALERLGFGKCYHMLEVTDEQVPLWQAVPDQAAGADFAWQDLFVGYASALDWPACGFWRPLLERYPDAMCILTVRDAPSWYESVRETIYQVSRRLAELDEPARRDRTRMVFSIIWDGVFQGRFEDRDFAVDTYRAHIEEVCASVPADRLLRFDVKQGWDPLCEFLGEEIPDEPFPRSNSAEEFKRYVQALAEQSLNEG